MDLQMGDLTTITSFGEWVRRRRQHLDLTQTTLARRVGCAAITIRKLESDERRPSRQMAIRLADSLAIAEELRQRFITIALGEVSVESLRVDTPAHPSPSTQLPEPVIEEIESPPSTTATESRQHSQQPAANDEIRVVTVVAAGISHAAETFWSLRPDEHAELVERMRAAMHTIFEQHEIQTEYSLEGGMVAAFGVPRLHEDDPERALQAALQIQIAAQKLGVPAAIGIHSGSVYLNGANGTGTTSLWGAAVNLSLRLQGQAGNGEIVVSKEVYQRTRRAFHFKPFASSHNGAATPIAAYLLLRPRQRMEKSRGIEGYPLPLIGREIELAKLDELVKALPTGMGQLVILSGEAGVGKSHLVARLKTKVLGQDTPLPDLLWLEGRSLEMTMSTGYAPFLDLLRSYLAWGPEDDEHTRAERLLLALQELVKTGHLSPAQIEKIGPLLGNLFSLHVDDEWDERLRQTRPEQIRQQTFQALYALLVALAKRQPLILVFEDLHWADGASLDLIAQLMEALPSIPLLLLCVCRPEQAHRSNQLATVALHKCPERFTEMRLRELPPRQSRELLHSLLGEELPDKVAQTILTRAQGNPLFIEEIVHTLISMDLLYRETNHWLVRANFGEAAVPDSVHSLLLSRVDRLSAEQKSILHHAAVIGRHFSLRLLSLTTPTLANHDDLLWQLEEKSFVFQERTLPEVVYSFRHILTYEAIYATIPRRRAKILHGEVAAALESIYADELAEHYEEVAYHYERSENLPKAVDYLLLAAQKARRAYLNEESIDYFGRALACLDKLPATDFYNQQRLAALSDLGQTYYHGTSQLDQAENAFRQALALGKSMVLPPKRLARLLVWLGDLLMNWQPRFDESLRLGHEALALLEDHDECHEVAWANALISFSHLMVGNNNGAIEYAFRSAKFAHRLPCTDEYDHLVYLSIVCAHERLRQVAEAKWWSEFSARHAEQHQHLHALGEALMCLARLAAAEGDTQVVIAKMQKAVGVFRQAGESKRSNWCHMAMLWFYLQTGELQAFKELTSFTLTQAELVNQEYLYDLYFCFGIAALAAGAWQEAEEHFHQAEQRSGPNSPSWVESQVALGYTYLAQGKTHNAVCIFERTATISLELPDFAIRSTRGEKDDSSPLIDALTGLDAALDDDTAMQSFCANLHGEHSVRDTSRFTQWFLRSSAVDEQFLGRGIEMQECDWQWQDHFGDCIHIFENGVTILAANARDLWYLNDSAPRLSHPVQGDFALQARCQAPFAEKPALGGIVLWHDIRNFVRLDWGSRGNGEITLMGHVDGENVIVGRGRLRSSQTYLRLERRGDQIRALCRGNGDEWFLAGQMGFAGRDPLEVALYAIGNIDRMVYHGRYPAGSAIHFDNVYLFNYMP